MKSIMPSVPFLQALQVFPYQLLSTNFITILLLYYKKRHTEEEDLYRLVFLTGPPDFQNQNEKQVAANQD